VEPGFDETSQAGKEELEKLVESGTEFTALAQEHREGALNRCIVCVCLTVCVSVLSIVRGKYDLWSLLMRRMKHLYSSDTERLAMCRLIHEDLSLSVDE